METPPSIHFYRYTNYRIAIAPIGGVTFYVTPAMAKQLARSLQAAVRDIHDNPRSQDTRITTAIITP